MIALDKQAHFLAGYAIGMTVGLYDQLAGFGAGVAAALLKEVYDYKHPETHTADVYDCWWTCAGSFMAAVVLLMFN